MADRTKDRDDKPVYDQELPNDEDLEEEPDESTEVEGEVEGDEGEEGDDEAFAAATAEAGGRRRFGFGRTERVEEETGRRRGPVGSVRETHERVHIDDRPSAIYAIVCAGALLGVLALTWLGSIVPPAAVPTLTPLVVPTSQATPVTSASASASAAPTITLAPTASPTAIPTASSAPSQ